MQNFVLEVKHRQWLQHVERMGTERKHKEALKYRPMGKRNIGRPGKRWKDHFTLKDKGQALRLTPHSSWWW
jgi:hypothetical protein